MSHVLPWWRRRVWTRFTGIGLAMIPALIVQTWRLDSHLPERIALLIVSAVSAVLLTHGFLPSRAATGERSRPAVGSLVLDAAIQATLIAALWPADAPMWPVLVALVAALLVQRLLGGWSVNPFPPVLLALCIGVIVARGDSGFDFSPRLVSVIDTALVAAGWLLMGAVLVVLRLWPARTPVAYLLLTVPVLALGGIASIHLVHLALLAGFVLADTRHLPSTPQGQWVLGAMAGLATIATWLVDATPLAIGFPLLGVYALMPWIEQLSLERPSSSAAP